MAKSKDTKTAPAPTIGRIVHYQTRLRGKKPSKTLAAIVAEVHEQGEATLHVIEPDGPHFVKANFSEQPEEGHWNWPPREEAAATESEEE